MDFLWAFVASEVGSVFRPLSMGVYLSHHLTDATTVPSCGVSGVRGQKSSLPEPSDGRLLERTHKEGRR